MAERTCSIDGCEKPHDARGWCGGHYQRWKKHGDPLAGVPLRQAVDGTPYERVMARTRRAGACVVFVGATNPAGYGVIGPNGDRSQLAHRVVLEHHYGPSDMLAIHSCDNPPCINIEHLRYGTSEDNAQDMARRLRTRWEGKLTPGLVRAIRADSRSGQAIADELGLSRSTINRVRSRRTWKWVD